MNKKYTQADIVGVGQLYKEGVSIADISRQTHIPYRTCIYWLKKLKAKGLKPDVVRTSEKIDFNSIAKQLCQTAKK